MDEDEISAKEAELMRELEEFKREKEKVRTILGQARIYQDHYAHSQCKQSQSFLFLDSQFNRI